MISQTTIFRDLAGIYFRGLCMGAADAVPGVSGGTIALITGIYQRLISAITAIDPRRLRRIVSGFRSEQRSDAVAALREIDIGFLIALGAGVGTAVVTILRVLTVLLSSAPVATYGFFFGLIAASALVLYSEISLSTRGEKTAAITGVLIAFSLSGYAATVTEPTLPVVFVAGAVAISAMVLPGVSGSLLLIMLGQYEYLSRTLTAFTDALGAIVTGQRAVLVEPGVPITVFLSGGVVGLITVAHTIRWALDTYREATTAFLISLIVGALRAPIEQTELALGGSVQWWTPAIGGLFVGSAVVGAVVVIAIDQLAGGVTSPQPSSTVSS
jgi:putative membrane protein